MIIYIHGESKHIPVSTVTIAKEEGKTHPFHCTNCGNTTNIIGGVVTRIYPILEPSSQVIVISTCRSCKSKYTFQESNVQTDGLIDVLLNPTGVTQSFYCYLGGGETKDENRIIEYDNRRAYSYIEHDYVDFPYVSKCTNPGCTAVYRFN